MHNFFSISQEVRSARCCTVNVDRCSWTRTDECITAADIYRKDTAIYLYYSSAFISIAESPRLSRIRDAHFYGIGASNSTQYVIDDSFFAITFMIRLASTMKLQLFTLLSLVHFLVDFYMRLDEINRHSLLLSSYVFAAFGTDCFILWDETQR